MCTEMDTGAPSGINLLLQVTYFLLLPNSMIFFCVLLYSIVICTLYVYCYVLLSVCCWKSVSVFKIVSTLHGKVSKSCSRAVDPCINALCDITKYTEASLILLIIVEDPLPGVLSALLEL